MVQSAAMPWLKAQQAVVRQEREIVEKSRLVQQYGPDAEDVEHMSERYIDEQLPGAVQVPRREDPRPR